MDSRRRAGERTRYRNESGDGSCSVRRDWGRERPRWDSQATISRWETVSRTRSRGQRSQTTQGWLLRWLKGSSGLVAATWEGRRRAGSYQACRLDQMPGRGGRICRRTRRLCRDRVSVGRSCEGGCARVSRADKSQGGSRTQAEDAIAANGGLSIETANGKQRGLEGFRGGVATRDS